jgi:hypothetical protein
MPIRNDVKPILDLLREYTTIQRVQQFLAERKLPRTAASWKELGDERIEAALEKGSISRADLIGLLSVSEEHGQQHVFLYRTTKAAQLMNPSQISRQLRSRGIEGVFRNPRVLDKPQSATIVDARLDGTGANSSFTLKVVETRIYRKPIGRREEGNSVIIDYEDIPTRAVNLFRLHSGGLLELRIQSYTNTTQYDEAVASMWSIADEIIPNDLFQAVALQNAKRELLQKREQLKNEIRHIDATLSNDAGISLRITTGETTDDLYADKAANKSLGDFLDPRAFGERLNLYFLHRDGVPLPRHETHVIVAGDVNEFAILGACSKEDYEYVLGQIIKHNQ